MGVIDIGSVLKKFDQTVTEGGQVLTYGIRFGTADGRQREIYHARKNVKSPKQSSEEDSTGKGKFKYNLKYHGTMLLHDENAEEHRSVKPPHMYQFRDHNSKTWLTIRH